MSGPAPTEVPEQFHSRLNDVVRMEVESDLTHKAMVRIRDGYFRSLVNRHGVSVSAIAKFTGMARPRVSAIVNKEGE